MSLQDRLEVLRTIPPAKLASRMPAWYKRHVSLCRGADCLKPIPTVKPDPVFVVRCPTLGPADSARDIVFGKFNGNGLTTAEYVKEFQIAAQHKGAEP